MRGLIRLFLLVAALSIPLSLLSGCGFLYDQLGGNFRGAPGEMDKNISAGAKLLIQRAFKATDLIADHHVHIAANGTSDQCRDAYVNSDLHTWRHPILRFKTRVLMSASGVDDLDKLDEQYEKRLSDLLLHFQSVQSTQSRVNQRPIKSQFYIYALDYYYDEHGQPDLERTDLHVPDDCVIQLAERLNRALGKKASGASVEIIPVASVHPYRHDFKEQVSRLAGQDVQFIKWLPPSMNIDMSTVKQSYYRALAAAGMTLLVHTGDEHAFRVYGKNQLLGDPWLLHYALDANVNATALHVGREGRHPVDDESYFERFMRMMGKDKYKGRLFGELSAITMDKTPLTQSSQPLIPGIIEQTRSGMLQGRIHNGSDYPLVGVAYLNPTKGLAKRGMITQAEKKWLDEIYAYNPLLFDFVVKRTLRHPDSRKSLPSAVFR